MHATDPVAIVNSATRAGDPAYQPREPGARRLAAGLHAVCIRSDDDAPRPADGRCGVLWMTIPPNRPAARAPGSGQWVLQTDVAAFAIPADNLRVVECGHEEVSSRHRLRGVRAALGDDVELRLLDTHILVQREGLNSASSFGPHQDTDEYPGAVCTVFVKLT